MNTPLPSQAAQNAALAYLPDPQGRAAGEALHRVLTQERTDLAAIIQGAIDKATAETQRHAVTLAQQAGALRGEIEHALHRMREATDDALDGCGLAESVAILISQRDNARGEAESHNARLSSIWHTIQASEQANDSGDAVRRKVSAALAQE